MGLVNKVLGTAGLRLVRLSASAPAPQGAHKYFNKPGQTPADNNTAQTYGAFYADDEARDQYYAEPGRIALIQAIADYARARLPLEGRDVLDVGCGTGHLLAAIHAGSNPKSLTGCDFAEPGMTFSRKRFPDYKFFVQDIYNPLPAPYDVILCTEVLEHLERPWVGLGNLMAAVRPGGALLLTVPNGREDTIIEHLNFWSPESWRAFIERECRGLEWETGLLPNGGNTAIIRGF